MWSRNLDVLLTVADTLHRILRRENYDILGLGTPFCKVLSAECRAQVLRAEIDSGI